MIPLIAAGFLFALMAPLVHRLDPARSGKWLTLVPLAMFIWLTTFLPEVQQGRTFVFAHPWFVSAGIGLDFMIDGLGLLFALIITGIGALVVFYASSYLHHHPKEGRFYAYILFFMTSMVGVVVSDNIFSLFVFWELTSISSFLLIGFNHESLKSRKAALQALLVTGGGGLALLAGLLIAGQMAGTYSLSGMIHAGINLSSHALYVPALILILAGAFTKSAQFPFHFWLPNAMEAPTPVSAYLHSATMVKAGVFLLARLNPVFSGDPLWQHSLMIVGGITMMTGAAMATAQHDLKRILAYTTVSALGIMVFLIGSGGKYAISAAISFLLVHSLYKGALFLVAGAIDHETGTRDIRQLGGLSKKMPLIFTAALLAALSYAGIPPFMGFIAKELIYETTLGMPAHQAIWTIAALLTNIFLVATAAMVSVRPFFGALKPTPKAPHEAPAAMWTGPMLLGAAGLITGLFPGTIAPLIQTAISNVAGVRGVELVLWHGFNTALMLSIVTLLAGAGWYLLTPKLSGITLPGRIARFGPENIWERGLEGLLKWADLQTNFFQDGRLRHYYYWILSTFTLLLFYTALRFGVLDGLQLKPDKVYFHEVMIVLLMIISTYKAVTSKTVLSSVAALGITGFGTALLFALFSAPDLALTQFSIETLTVLLLVFIVYKVPRFGELSSARIRRRDAFISAIAGLSMSLLVLLAMQLPEGERISSYFTENSYTLAHGRNIVNVILVDFRALDTMGEIVVLALAAIGVFTLLRFRTRSEKSSGSE
ncbi:MAG TPA: putative monovalent cation/H+ antiporter subunit A [Bacteroidales bacterium]|nr:putative monovalent cation/H+ antiporter subunit A [Bacteroidales bacterium]